MLCYWVASDRLSMHYANSGILHGGSGLMSKDGIPKPCYYALYFLSKLQGNILKKGDEFIAVQNSNDSIYILCYNHKEMKENSINNEDTVVDARNVDSMYDDTRHIKIKFILDGLVQGGEYVVKRHMVNQEYGSVMDEWKRLGYEPRMRSNDIDYLKNVCVPRIQMEHRIAQEGQVQLEAELKAHEMLLLHVYKCN